MSTSVKRTCSELNRELPTKGVIKSISISGLNNLVTISIDTEVGLVYKMVQSTRLKVGQRSEKFNLYLFPLTT